MNLENTKYLLETYPILYGQHKLSPKETLMCWLFECSDGWLKLIDDLSAKIVAIDPIAEVMQVKEKYGGLRYYMGPLNIETADQIYKLIEEAEDLSYKTCEECGTMENVSTNKQGWLYTLCDQCRKDLYEKRHINYQGV